MKLDSPLAAHPARDAGALSISAGKECIISGIVVYGVPGSPFVRAVQLGLAEKGVPYRLQTMTVGEAKSEAYLVRHPFGRVPAFEHGDFRLYETQAILRYLDDVFPEPPLVPSDPRAAVRMNQIIGINDWYFFPKAAAVIAFQRLVGLVLLGTSTDEAAAAAAGRWLVPASASLIGSWGRSASLLAIGYRLPI